MNTEELKRRWCRRRGAVTLMTALLRPEALTQGELAELSHPLCVELALSEGLGGALYSLVESGQLTLSERSEARLLQERLKQVWLEEARSAALVSAWPQQLPAPLLIKGASYSPRLGGTEALWGEGERASSDLDLLVPCSLEELARAFKAQLSPQQSAARAKRSACLALELSGLLTECHTAVAPPLYWPKTGELSARAMWTRGEERALLAHPHGERRSLSVRVPSHVDALVIALAQLLKGGGDLRLRDWLDLTRLLQRVGAALEEASRSSAWRELGLDRCLQLALVGLSQTPAWAQLPTEHRALKREGSRGVAALTPLAHPLSGHNATLAERLYIKALLMKGRPFARSLLQ